MVTKLGNKDLNMVSTETELREMLQALNQESPSLISVDAEGWDLSRDGTLSLLALCWNDHVVYVIDVQELGPTSLTTVSGEQSRDFKWSSVKQLLEDQTTVKLFCDPRSDSDALYHHYGIHLKNVFCVQLAEVGVRRQARPRSRFVCGGKKITLEYGGLENEERAEFVQVDQRANKLFFPDKGGSYDNLTRRPLSAIALKYSAMGVVYLLRIYQKLEGRLQQRGKVWVKRESEKRADECLLPSYSQGRHRAIAPAHWGNTTSYRQYVDIDDYF